MPRLIATIGASLVLAVALAGCGGDGAGASGGIVAPSLESPLQTEETSVGGGASPSPAVSASP